MDAFGLRPMSARSVVASVLLGSHPPELPVAALVHLCSRFGIAEGTTRVALSRMVAAGELAAVEPGAGRRRPATPPTGWSVRPSWAGSGPRTRPGTRPGSRGTAPGAWPWW